MRSVCLIFLYLSFKYIFTITIVCLADNFLQKYAENAVRLAKPASRASLQRDQSGNCLAGLAASICRQPAIAG